MEVAGRRLRCGGLGGSPAKDCKLERKFAARTG